MDYGRNYAAIHSPVRKSERYRANCAKCGRDQMKQEMTTLLVRQGKYGSAKTLCHVCEGCLPELLDELEVTMPG